MTFNFFWETKKNKNNKLPKSNKRLSKATGETKKNHQKATKLKAAARTLIDKK